MAIKYHHVHQAFYHFYQLVYNSNVETTHRLRSRCKARFRLQLIGQVEFDEGRGPPCYVVAQILDFGH